jgi:hypothetical protein
MRHEDTQLVIDLDEPADNGVEIVPALELRVERGEALAIKR